ncbi:MAG: tRNA uridine-5-carboxymethylaminomethyl(34) synthesis enzyme MnmG [Spirochaetia bacterium]
MDYEAIVIGAGHAGIEASLVLSRLGIKTVLITQTIESIGRISCNPAVGGLAKGNIVREIDALGGQMAHLADGAMLQYRMLNESRGGAAQSPRAQIDKYQYATLARLSLDQEKNLSIYQETVIDLILDTDGRTCCGVVLQRGRQMRAKAVIICSGTFMEGRIMIGSKTFAHGRIGEPAALGLGQALRGYGLSVGRLSTSTSARVRFRSLDLEAMQKQQGDEPMIGFSFASEKSALDRPGYPCYIVYTNEQAHKVIRDNIDLSPIYTEFADGPRYCPSIEEKVMRFPNRDRHHIFIEPESAQTDDAYLNGLYCGLPEELQEEFLHKIPGMEHAEIVKPGYAVEYDYVDAREHHLTLESQKIAGLYFAGQVNGSSGYEEAAGQGFWAGVNAALKIKKEPEFIINRFDAYLAVLIDDLVTKGTKEPYRMFASRAEYRMRLRHDSADRRLFQRGVELGLHSEERRSLFNEKIQKLDIVKELLHQRRVAGKTLYQQLQDPQYALEDAIALVPELKNLPPAWQKTLYLDIRYAGYEQIEEEQVQKLKRHEKTQIPPDFDYDKVTNLSTESRTKLAEVRPQTMGQASRISGVRQSDIAILQLILHHKVQA